MTRQLKGQQRLFGNHGGPRDNAGRTPDHPSGRKRSVTLSLSPEAHRRLWAIARANEISRSQVIDELLRSQP